MYYFFSFWIPAYYRNILPFLKDLKSLGYDCKAPNAKSCLAIKEGMILSVFLIKNIYDGIDEVLVVRTHKNQSKELSYRPVEQKYNQEEFDRIIKELEDYKF